jgi:ABC-type hemin transport system ATPase subunit
VAVIADGRLAAHGPPAQIPTRERLSAVCGVPVTIEHTPSGRAVIVPSDR